MSEGIPTSSEATRDAPVLALVTCGPLLEVALEGPGIRTASLVRLGGVSRRSTLILAAVDLIVEDAGLDPEELGTIVVSRGPGSFTGIRAGLATAAGLMEATGAQGNAYDSLLMHATRYSGKGEIWCAQPGRRGEVYARSFRVAEGQPPQALGEIEVISVPKAGDRGPWLAANSLNLGDAERGMASLSAAEALLRLSSMGVISDPLEPLYVEGPPIHQPGADDRASSKKRDVE